MWEYNHTETMFNNSSELYHSDIYLGQDHSDGIRHYKYVKRVRKNGRWVYYYKDDLYDKANATAKKSYKKAMKDMKNLGKLESRKAKLENYATKKMSEVSSADRELKNAKWYEKTKKETLKKEKRSNEDFARRAAKDVHTANKQIKKADRKFKDSAYDGAMDEDRAKRIKRKDLGKKLVAKALVKGLNTYEIAKKAYKDAPGKIQDSTSYAKAKMGGYSTYKDSKGRTRITDATEAKRKSPSSKRTKELLEEEARLNKRIKDKKKKKKTKKTTVPKPKVTRSINRGIPV